LNQYEVGDLLRYSGEFRNSGGTLIDPTTVTFKARNPAGTITSYLYGTDAQVVKDSTGIYHVDWSLTSAGKWYFRIESTGTGQAADEEEVLVVTAFD
jgi:hypothetical protein